MQKFSTREAAGRLGLSPIALSRYVAVGKVPAPEIVKTGKATLHLWTEADIERLRKLLLKIKNGRKTRYKKKNQPQSKRAVPHKKRK